MQRTVVSSLRVGQSRVALDVWLDRSETEATLATTVLEPVLLTVLEPVHLSHSSCVYMTRILEL